MNRKMLQLQIIPAFVDVDDDGEMGDVRQSQPVLVKGRDWKNWSIPPELKRLIDQAMTQAFPEDAPTPENRQARRAAERNIGKMPAKAKLAAVAKDDATT